MLCSLLLSFGHRPGWSCTFKLPPPHHQALHPRGPVRRSHQYYVQLFDRAGLRMTHTALQKDFPKGLFKGGAPLAPAQTGARLSLQLPLLSDMRPVI